MKQQYKIEGMACSGCVFNVKKGLSTLAEIENIDVKLEYPQAELTLKQEVSVEVLQEAIGAHYQISTI